MHPFQVIVKFGSGLDPDFQGRAMLHWEKWMREEGLPVEVLKATAPDDLRSRATLTIEERNNL
jgi:hypothetical protein